MCAYGSINGQSDFGGQPQPSAEQGVLCCKRSFMQQKTYLAMFPENIKIRLLKRTCSDRSIMTGQMDYSLYRYMRLD